MVVEKSNQHEDCDSVASGMNSPDGVKVVIESVVVVVVLDEAG
jgi:hypothetical protein